MLTFEQVLSAFKDYLSEDTMYEVLATSRGYTVMEWDESSQDWDSAKICHTPVELKSVLLDAYAGYLAYRTTLGRRSMTDSERRDINAQVDRMDKSVQ